MRLNLLVLVLAWGSRHLPVLAAPCPSLEQNLAISHLVTEASLVSRSRAQQGHYYATFRIDKILQVRTEQSTNQLSIPPSPQKKEIDLRNIFHAVLFSSM